MVTGKHWSQSKLDASIATSLATLPRYTIFYHILLLFVMSHVTLSSDNSSQGIVSVNSNNVKNFDKLYSQLHYVTQTKNNAS